MGRALFAHYRETGSIGILANFQRVTRRVFCKELSKKCRGWIPARKIAPETGPQIGLLSIAHLAIVHCGFRGASQARSDVKRAANCLKPERSQRTESKLAIIGRRFDPLLVSGNVHGEQRCLYDDFPDTLCRLGEVCIA